MWLYKVRGTSVLTRVLDTSVRLVLETLLFQVLLPQDVQVDVPGGPRHHADRAAHPAVRPARVLRPRGPQPLVVL